MMAPILAAWRAETSVKITARKSDTHLPTVVETLVVVVALRNTLPAVVVVAFAGVDNVAGEKVLPKDVALWGASVRRSAW